MDILEKVFFSKFKNKCPSDEDIKGKKDIVKLVNIKNEEEITRLYRKSNVLLLTCVSEKFIKVSIIEISINSRFCVSVPSYTWQCGLK